MASPGNQQIADLIAQQQSVSMRLVKVAPRSPQDPGRAGDVFVNPDTGATALHTGRFWYWLPIMYPRDEAQVNSAFSVQLDQMTWMNDTINYYLSLRLREHDHSEPDEGGVTLRPSRFYAGRNGTFNFVDPVHGYLYGCWY